MFSKFEESNIDHHEFDSLMNRHGEELMRLAFTYVKNKQVAEDIIQDVFLCAYENMNSFRRQSSYKTYLYRLTINRCHDYFRSWSYKNTVLTNTLSHFLSSEPSPEKQILINENNHNIGKAVFSLPVKYREIIVLYYYKHLSIEEIAELLNCPSNTVKTRLSRSREKLRKLFKNQGSEALEK